jgi:hypothetical protein
MTNAIKPLGSGSVKNETDEIQRELEKLSKVPDLDTIIGETPDANSGTPSDDDKKTINHTVDEVAAENGENKTQDNWTTYWNNTNDDRIMASMGDLYAFFKDIKVMHDCAETKTHAEKLIADIRDDCEWTTKNNCLISSTRINYEPNCLEGKITQHYDSKQKQAVKETNTQIPVYQGMLITEVLEQTEGLKYLQELLETKDNKETIIQTFELISGKPRTEIKVWTPNEQGRKDYPDRATGFECDDVEFRINGSYDLNSSGRSRGVRRAQKISTGNGGTQ